MKRFRIRQFGQEGWTQIEIRGDLAEGLHNLIAHALEAWSSKLHVQELIDGRWEDLA